MCTCSPVITCNPSLLVLRGYEFKSMKTEIKYHGNTVLKSSSHVNQPRGPLFQVVIFFKGLGALYVALRYQLTRSIPFSLVNGV